MTTNWRALCAELMQELESALDDIGLVNEPGVSLIDRARAALSQPEPEGPTRDDAVAVYTEVMAAHDCQTLGDMAEHFARAVLARWGHQPAPLPAGEVVGLTDEELERQFQAWWYDEGSGMPPGADEDQEAHVRRISWIAWHNGAYVARWGHPAPAPAGEVAEPASKRLPGP